MRSIATPACDAACSARMTPSSVSAFIFALMRAGLAFARVARLAADHLDDAPVHRERREQQALHAARLRQARDVPEDLVDVGADVGIGGEQAEVRVGARVARMVVARAEVRVEREPRLAVVAGLAAQDERELRMRLEAEDAVHDLRAGVLEPLGPVDVRFLVEARHQLDDDRDFLAALRGLDQRFHQHRVDARAIDRLLDRDDVGVVGRAPDELHHRIERLERVMEQDVVAPDRREDVGLAGQAAPAAPARTAGT
jgi:hypothetical protein